MTPPNERFIGELERQAHDGCGDAINEICRRVKVSAYVTDLWGKDSHKFNRIHGEMTARIKELETCMMEQVDNLTDYPEHRDAVIWNLKSTVGKGM